MLKDTKDYNFLQKCESITQSAQWNQLDTPDVIWLLDTIFSYQRKMDQVCVKYKKTNEKLDLIDLLSL